jgi:hypothetical protein
VRIRAALSVLAGFSIALVTAGQAAATTTVSRAGNVITITGGDEVNYVEQVDNAAVLRYTDPNGINFGDGCVDAGTGNTVECGNLGPGLVANVTLGGGDDTFRPDAILSTAPRLTVSLGDGNDTMWGSAQADSIDAGPGDDVVNGRGGNDTIDGGPGNDQLSGATGDDQLTGGAGRDSLFGDGEFTTLGAWGNDTLLARDGEPDALSCSLGADAAVADPIDTFDAVGDCEQIDSGGGGGGGPSGGGGPAGGGGGGGSTPAPLSVGIAGARGKLGGLAAGRPLTFRATFSAACKAVGVVRVSAREAKRRKLGRKQLTLARSASDVPEAGTYEAKLTVAKKYRKRLRALKKLAVTIEVSCAGAGGATAKTTRALTLR